MLNITPEMQVGSSIDQPFEANDFRLIKKGMQVS